MAPKGDGNRDSKRVMNKGAWTVEEDRMLSEFIEVHGAKKWKTVAVKSGLNRCGKSCRLRWLNYLRPNIKRGNISDQEEDLIVRLHKLLGNRWSLIAGRLPGRTDNEIKNYWNSHLCKKMEMIQEELKAKPSPDTSEERNVAAQEPQEVVAPTSENNTELSGNSDLAFDFVASDAFDFSIEGPRGMEWIDRFLEFGDEAWMNGI
ncbi:hypothetical protein MLD38_036516 [Melastoma candidum]|uniref:Uncharacterized protein n=1 Tax=Melastoma candidum TaxID=119954 RepID=A0ACB9LJX5_9MYRT|nr:hypothetical protein MLD38_036516 [Melastoma candidum]